MIVLQAQLRLQAVVDGETSVGVLDDAAEVAVCVPYRVSELIGGQRKTGALKPTTGLRGIRACGDACREEFLKSILDQRQDVGIAIDFLEILHVVIAHVADLQADAVRKLPL